MPRQPHNLVAHKLGPAIAGGNALILKTSALTPLSALRLVDTSSRPACPRKRRAGPVCSQSGSDPSAGPISRPA
ncbi:aldehyde dehydrogenase family protein [Streptomyces sp. NPDC055509]